MMEAKAILDAADDQDRRSDYLFCAPGGLFWDGSAETCDCHPETRKFGRLLNFASADSRECNAKPQLFQLPQFTCVLIVATRDIEPLEEIRFDYGDEKCRELFIHK
jgi:hypothetical protein